MSLTVTGLIGTRRVEKIDKAAIENRAHLREARRRKKAREDADNGIPQRVQAIEVPDRNFSKILHEGSTRCARPHVGAVGHIVGGNWHQALSGHLMHDLAAVQGGRIAEHAHVIRRQLQRLPAKTPGDFTDSTR